MNAVEVVHILVWVVQGYLALGAILSVPLALFFLHRIDPSAREGTWGFRIIVIPGLVLLWPLFFWRLVRKQSAPTESNTHRNLEAARANNTGE